MATKTDSDLRLRGFWIPGVNFSSRLNCRGWVSCNPIKGSGCFISVQMNSNFIKLWSIYLLVQKEDLRCLVKTVRFLRNALSFALDLKRDFQGCALPKRGCKSCVLACCRCRVNKEQGLAIEKTSKYQGLMCAWENWLGFSVLQRHYTFMKHIAGPCLVHRAV